MHSLPLFGHSSILSQTMSGRQNKINKNTGNWVISAWIFCIVALTVNSELAKPGWFLEFESNVKEDLAAIKKSLLQTLNANVLERRIENCATALSNGNDQAAKRFWEMTRPQLLPPAELKSLSSRIMDKVDLVKTNGTSLAVINFFNAIDYPGGLELLWERMENTTIMRNNSDIFLLAHHYRIACGIRQGLFPKLPYIVQNVISGGVELRNTKNRGYLFSNASTIFTTSSRQMKSRSSHPSLWVFKLDHTRGNVFAILNKYGNDTPILGAGSRFVPEFVDSHTLRILVAHVEETMNKNDTTDISGKYLASSETSVKTITDEIVFPTEFLNVDEDPERINWTVEDTVVLGSSAYTSKNC